METIVKSNGYNLLALLGLVIISSVFGLIEGFLTDYSTILRWIFIVPTVAFFWVAGKTYPYLGAFNSVWWKLLFVILVPVVLLVDIGFDKYFDWYKGVSVTSYYGLFTLRFLILKIPSVEDIIEYQVKEGYN